MATRRNRMMIGGAKDYLLGSVGPTDSAIDAHMTKRLRQWFGRKHTVKSGKDVLFSNEK